MPSAARGASEPVPLGSLTQRGASEGSSCAACGSTRVTHISLRLADGSPVELTSCHACEHRSWTERGLPLSVARVLDKARRNRPSNGSSAIRPPGPNAPPAGPSPGSSAH